MTKAQLQRILSGANITETENISIPEFRTIISTTNQGLNYHRDQITFDFNNNILKLKQYEYKAANGRVADFTTTDNITLWAKGFNISSLNRAYPFRNINIGDRVFKVNKETGAIVAKYWTVTNVGTRFITLDRALTYNPKNEYLCYCELSSFDSLVPDMTENCLFFKYNALSNNTYDFCIAMEKIVGIELISPKVGLS